MNTLFSMLCVAFGCSIVYLAFLMFSEIDFKGLILVLMLVLIIGFYLNYEVGNAARGKSYGIGYEDPWTGAVNLWADGSLVFCRFFELLGRGCCKNKF